MTLDEAVTLAGIRGIAPLIPALNEAFPTFLWSLDLDRGLVVVESATPARDGGVWLDVSDGPGENLLANLAWRDEAKAELAKQTLVPASHQSRPERHDLHPHEKARIAQVEAAMRAQAQKLETRWSSTASL